LGRLGWTGAVPCAVYQVCIKILGGFGSGPGMAVGGARVRGDGPGFERFAILCKSVPKAAGRDPVLHELLALVDALRDGRARERRIAERELSARLRELPRG